MIVLAARAATAAARPAITSAAGARAARAVITRAVFPEAALFARAAVVTALAVAVAEVILRLLFAALGALVLEHGLARQANLTRRVNVDDLDQQLLTFVQLVAHVADAVVGNLGNVQQAVGARQDFDERAEVGEPLHSAQVSLVEFGHRRDPFDDRFRG